ncbi:MAG: DNA internalization-related competence protein ComEC/Rec2 [bacterium]
MKKINNFGGAFFPWSKSLRFHRGLFSPLAMLLALLAGIILAAGSSCLHTDFDQIDDLSPCHLTHYLPQDPNSIPQPITLVGRIIEPPEKFSQRVRLHLEVQKIILPEQNIMTSARAQLNWYKPKIPCQFYDTVQITAHLEAPQDYKNPGGFSYSKYLSQKGICATGSIRMLSLCKEAKTIPWTKSILRAVYGFRWRASEYIENTIPQPGSSILQAILLGERYKVSNRIKDLFSEAGAIHLLSISGFHIATLALAVFACFRGILRALPDRLFEILCCIIRPSSLAALFSIPVIILYTVMTGSKTTTIRACIMVSSYFLALLFERRRSLFRPLVLAALAILLWQPDALFKLDFQLTFLASSGIVFILACDFPRHLNPDSGLSLQGILVRLKDSLFLSCCLSLAAFLMTSPLVAYTFNLISPIGIVTNLAAIPLVSGILYAGLGGILALPLHPGLAAHFFRIAAFLARLMISLSATITRIAGAFVYLPSPPKAAIMAIYGSLVIAAFIFHFLTRSISPRKKTGLLIAFLLLAFVLMPLLLLFMTRPPRFIPNDTLTVTFLDVGRGDACVIQTPGGKYILIDGGGSYNNEFDFGHRLIAPYLWHKRIPRLDLVVLSHPHPDHLNGLLFVLKHFDTACVWKTKERSDSREYRLFEDIIREKKVPLHIVAAGEEAELDGVFLQVLAAGNLPDLPISSKITYKEENNRSLVLKLSYRQVSFLFTGDIEAKAERCLLSLGEKLRSTVLKVPHHGSRSSSSIPFLRMVLPQTAVFSGRSYGRQKFPHPKTLERYRKLPCRIYRTDLDGAITAETDGVECKFSTYADIFADKSRHPSWFKTASDYPDSGIAD